jgi:thioredoxin reductase
MAVPTVFLNGTRFGQGRMSLEEILAKIDTGAVKRDAAKIDAKDPFDVLIVGGGPAGAAAAVYAARKGIRTGIASERFGGQVLDTLGIENFVSVKETEGPRFALALEEHVRHYDVDIMNLQRAKALVPGRELIEVKLESGASLAAKTVVITTGARWRNVNVPGEQEYRNKGVAYCPHCDGPLFKGKRVAVIGGGNSGVEAAIDLAGIVAHVTLIEFDSRLRADAVLQRKLASLPNVTTLVNAQTTEITGDSQRVDGLLYRDHTSGEQQRIDLEGVFVQIGLVPNTEWLKGTVELSRHGEIIVDARGQTSVPGVFAAGDATTVPFKQIIIAAGDGANCRGRRGQGRAGRFRPSHTQPRSVAIRARSAGKNSATIARQNQQELFHARRSPSHPAPAGTTQERTHRDQSVLPALSHPQALGLRQTGQEGIRRVDGRDEARRPPDGPHPRTGRIAQPAGPGQIDSGRERAGNPRQRPSPRARRAGHHQGRRRVLRDCA